MNKTPVSDSEIRTKVSGLARRLYGQSSLEAIRHTLGSALGDMIGHDSILFCDGDRVTGCSIYHAQTAGDSILPYLPVCSQFVHQNPFVPYYLKHPGAEAMRTFDVIRPAVWKRRELFNEAFKPMGLEEQLGVEIPGNPRFLRGFMLNRQRIGFSNRDVQVLDLLRGHIAAACGITEQWLRLDLGQAVTGNEAAGRHGSILLDARGHAVLWSPVASFLMMDYADAGQVRRRRLPARVEAWVRREVELHEDDELWATPRRGLHLMNGDRQLTLRLSSTEDGHAHVILMEESAHAERHLEALKSLSAREREVLEWVSQGKTNEEIARILGTSVFTVKNHVKRILSCLGTENRTAAAAVWLRVRAS